MKLLPQVKEFQQLKGDFFLNNTIEIVIKKDDSEGLSTAFFMSKRLEEITLKKFPVTVSEKECCNNSIILECRLTEKSSEGYSLICSPEKIVISGDSPAGVFYGAQTLIQIFTLHPNSIPCFKIFDSPDITHRGYYHDVTRGKVPKLETLKVLVEKIASYKINELQLYIEHSFAFKQIPELWIDKDPITPEEILELDQYCKKFHVDSNSFFGNIRSPI